MTYPRPLHHLPAASCPSECLCSHLLLLLINTSFLKLTLRISYLGLESHPFQYPMDAHLLLFSSSMLTELNLVCYPRHISSWQLVEDISVRHRYRNRCILQHISGLKLVTQTGRSSLLEASWSIHSGGYTVQQHEVQTLKAIRSTRLEVLPCFYNCWSPPEEQAVHTRPYLNILDPEPRSRDMEPCLWRANFSDRVG